MALNLKIIVPAVIVVIVAVVVGYSRFKGTTEVVAPPKITETVNQGNGATTPPPTKPPQGNDTTTPSPTKPPQQTTNTNKTIDDTINLFLQDAFSETTSVIKEGNDDANIISSDSQTVSDFGQVYDENEF